jgi:hypothetical protein
VFEAIPVFPKRNLSKILKAAGITFSRVRNIQSRVRNINHLDKTFQVKNCELIFFFKCNNNFGGFDGRWEERGSDGPSWISRSL